MNLPKISIVTPNFNGAAFLEQTVRSVLDQEYPNLEYRIMDGGSTDGSVEIIRRYSNRLAGWISAPDQGQADAIARGFAECSGEILAYLNSDDVYLPGALASAAEAFSRHPEAELIYGDIVFVDNVNRPLVLDVLPEFQFEDLRRVCVIPQPAAFWRREAYERAGGIDAEFQFAMDYDLFLRIAHLEPETAETRIRHWPKLMANFRWHARAKSSNALGQWAEEDRRLREHYLGRRSWNRHDHARLKSLTRRQIGCIAARRLRGERFPCLTPARWTRLAQRKLTIAT